MPQISFDISNTTIKWKGGRVSKSIRRALGDALEIVGTRFVTNAKQAISVPYPPASSPGDPPHKRTGNLQANVDYWLDRRTLVLHMGPTVDAEYGIFLEFGTSRMEPRPWLMPTLIAIKPKILKMVAAVAKGKLRKYLR